MKRRTIKAAWSDGGHRRVEAIVFGQWAVHQRFGYSVSDIPARERWGVTHLPTGGQAIRPWMGVTRSEAIAAARALNRRLPKMGGQMGIVSSVNEDDWRCAGATIAEVLAEGRAR